MVLEPIYLDLSSSDDDDEDHNRAGSTALLYLSKVFHMDVDDDDVRIIDKPASNGKVKRDKARVIRSSLDDDECCILDTDPGADATPDIVSSLDTDELVMTGEKGPVACRDFPHARYLCVHFPFKTTLHSKFCAQCHCYVCDSLAPCSLWGEGNNPNDHCHASEEPGWKTLRKVAKWGSVPSLATGAAGGSRLVQSSLSQQASITSPVTQPPVGTPVGSGVSRMLQATVKRDPLIIKLKGKGRGKISQPPHLGVRSSRPSSRPHRILPLSSFPGHRNPPQPRTTSTPSERLEEVEFPLPTAAQSPQPTNPNSRLGRPGAGATVAAIPPHPRSMTNLNPLPGRARGEAVTRPPVQLPQPTLNANPTVFSPVPNTLPPFIPASPLVTSDVSLLRPLGADASVPDFVSSAPMIPDSRYVPASALTDLEVSDVYMDPFHEDHSTSEPHKLSMIIDADYVGQSFSSPVNSAQNASSSHTVDILSGPIEGWEVDAAAEFDSFAAGISDVVTSPEQVTTSLNDVLEQMAGDDYLWEQFPGW